MIHKSFIINNLSVSRTKNRQILLASHPSGEPSQDNFRLAETDIPKPGPGQMLLRTIYLSLDPYMRGRMKAGPSYAQPVEIRDRTCPFLTLVFLSHSCGTSTEKPER